MPFTLIKRAAEVTLYNYDFVNDAVIDQGDPIQTITSVTAKMVVGSADTLLLGAPILAGKRVVVQLSAGTDGARYLMTFTIVTKGGWTRVGLGYLNIVDA